MNDYDHTIVNFELNSDETDFLVGILENYDYATNAERLLINGLLDKLTEE